MMETDQNKPSIIANLMGLDKMPPQQQLIYRRQRVLSDNYLQKSASLGSRKGRQKSCVVSKNANSVISNSSKDGSSRYIGQKSGEKRKLEKGLEGRNDSFQLLNLPRKIVVLRPNIGNIKYGSKPSFLYDSNANFAWDLKKQLLERSRMREVCQEFGFGTESKQRLKLGRTNESVCKLPIFTRFSFSSNPERKIKKTFKIDVKSSKNVPSYGDMMIKRISEQIVCKDSVKEGCSSSSSDVSLEQAREDGFLSSKCMEIDNEFSKKTGEAYQPSPNSVLEPPFKEDSSSSSEYDESVSTDLHGLWMKLQILKSESEDNRSKPEMITSSDEDTTEKSFHTGQNTKPIISYLGPKKAREFSYLINVLEQSRFNGNNTECMINPLVFETLEKKHAKQESWSKTDRRLLFDRIKSALSESLGPPVNFPVCLKPLRRQASEEELWRFLVRQETDVNGDLSEKAVGREPWLELGDEVELLIREIEGYLFNELVTEFVGI